jgi:GNAT superfamily N-acetyltransferase
VGFAHVKLLERSRAHLDELDVDPDHARRGVGRRLVRTVCDWAAGSYLDAVTLSTFREPPWNAPFYASMGFRALTEPELTPALRRVVAQETRRGLDPTQRVVMCRDTLLAQSW